MKKILIISQHYPPEIGAASNRLSHIVSHLLENGYHVYLLTSKPNYPQPSLYRSMEYKEQEHDRLNIYRCPVVPGSLPLLSRLVNQLFFLFFGLWLSSWICIRHSIHKCITTSPPFMVNVIGVWVSKILRTSWVMEVRDLWPDSMVAVGAIRESHPLFKLFKRLEYMFYKASQHIVVVTYHTKGLLTDRGIPQDKITVITNGIPDWIKTSAEGTETSIEDTLDVQIASDGPAIEAEDMKPLNKTFTGRNAMNVMYIGNMGLSQNLGIILDSAHQLKDNRHIQFYLIGEGLDKEKLIRKAQQLQLTNVHFIDGITEKDELKKWYLRADLGIISLRNSALFQSVIPSKVFEYGGLDVPILFIGSGEVAEIIENYDLGSSIDVNASKVSESIGAFSDKWKQGYNVRKHGYHHQDTPNRMQTEFNDHFSWEQLIQKYIEVLNT